MKGLDCCTTDRWDGPKGRLRPNEGSRSKHHEKARIVDGVTGQDGAYLAEFLLGKGYEVHGIKRRASQFNTHRIDHLYQDPHEQSPAWCCTTVT